MHRIWFKKSISIPLYPDSIPFALLLSLTHTLECWGWKCITDTPEKGFLAFIRFTGVTKPLCYFYKTGYWSSTNPTRAAQQWWDCELVFLHIFCDYHTPCVCLAKGDSSHRPFHRQHRVSGSLSRLSVKQFSRHIQTAHTQAHSVVCCSYLGMGCDVGTTGMNFGQLAICSCTFVQDEMCDLILTSVIYRSIKRKKKRIRLMTELI